MTVRSACALWAAVITLGVFLLSLSGCSVRTGPGPPPVIVPVPAPLPPAPLVVPVPVPYRPLVPIVPVVPYRPYWPYHPHHGEDCGLPGGKLLRRILHPLRPHHRHEG